FIFTDIDKLSFEQLREFEKLCLESKETYSLLLVGDEKIRELVNSFYLKNLRKAAEVLIGCGNLKKEEVKTFAENFLRELLEKEIKLDKDIETYLYRISEGNEKKLERLLKKISVNIKDDVLTKEHLKDYIIEKEEFPEKEKVEIKNIKETLPLKPVAIAVSTILVLGGIALFFLGDEEKNKKESEKVAKVEQKKETAFPQENNRDFIENKSSPSQTSSKNNTQQNQNKEQVSSLQPQMQENTASSPKEEKQKTEEKTVSEKTSDKYFPTKTVIVLRENPDKNSKIVGKIRKKSPFEKVLVEGTEKQNNWVKVKYQSGDKEIEGWTERKNLVKVPKGKAVIIARSLNLRENPSLQSRVLTAIPYGTVVDVLDEMVVGNRKWLKVMYIDRKGNIYEGWISARFVIYNKGDEEKSP
ncbi:MAG: SH3 domain-containing protein, partial [Aquificae bacterium]|nr:SH3 domain-containing protein [Aquificota bacterium]